MGGNNQNSVIVIAVSLHFNLFYHEGRHGKYGQSRVILLVTDTRKFSTDLRRFEIQNSRICYYDLVISYQLCMK